MNYLARQTVRGSDYRRWWKRRECCSSLAISLIAGRKTHKPPLPKTPLFTNPTPPRRLGLAVCARELNESLSMQLRALSKAFSPDTLVINTRSHLSERSDHLEAKLKKRGKRWNERCGGEERGTRRGVRTLIHQRREGDPTERRKDKNKRKDTEIVMRIEESKSVFEKDVRSRDDNRDAAGLLPWKSVGLFPSVSSGRTQRLLRAFHYTHNAESSATGRGPLLYIRSSTALTLRLENVFSSEITTVWDDNTVQPVSLSL